MNHWLSKSSLLHYINKQVFPSIRYNMFMMQDRELVVIQLEDIKLIFMKEKAAFVEKFLKHSLSGTFT